MNEVATVDRPQAPTSESMAMIQMMERVALNPDADIEKLKAIMQMKKDLFMQGEEIAFNEALARVQLSLQPVIRDAENKQTKSMYGKYDTIVKVTSPIYAAEGFAISFNTDACPVAEHAAKGWFRVEATVARGAFSRKHHVDLPPDLTGIAGTVNKTGLHAFKSTLTYGKAMLLCMIFNIVLKDNGDDDGNRGNGVVEPVLSNEAADWIALVQDATTLDQLQKDYTSGFQELTKLKDNYGKGQLIKAKDAKKKELANG